MKMWSGRFRQPLDPDFERWQRSFGFDRRLLQYELAASSAHARALKDAGILSASELISILQGLQQIGAQAAASPAVLEDNEAEDVHHFVEKKLAALIGETGYKLHSGRSRNEQIATDLRLFVRAAIDQLRVDIAEWCGVAADRAEQAGDSAIYAFAARRTGSGWALVDGLHRDVSAGRGTARGLPQAAECLPAGIGRGCGSDFAA